LLGRVVRAVIWVLTPERLESDPGEVGPAGSHRTFLHTVAAGEALPEDPAPVGDRSSVLAALFRSDPLPEPPPAVEPVRRGWFSTLLAFESLPEDPVPPASGRSLFGFILSGSGWTTGRIKFGMRSWNTANTSGGWF